MYMKHSTLHQHNTCPLQDHGNILQEGSHARPKSKLCWCPLAFVKGYHKCKGLKHQRVILSLCWGPENSEVSILGWSRNIGRSCFLQRLEGRIHPLQLPASRSGMPWLGAASVESRHLLPSPPLLLCVESPSAIISQGPRDCIVQENSDPYLNQMYQDSVSI